MDLGEDRPDLLAQHAGEGRALAVDRRHLDPELTERGGHLGTDEAEGEQDRSAAGRVSGGVRRWRRAAGHRRRARRPPAPRAFGGARWWWRGHPASARYPS